jgi:hypothetical protein
MEPKIRRLPARRRLTEADIIKPAFRLDRDGRLEIYYAPLDWVRPTARVAIVGITPSKGTMLIAYQAVSDGLAAGRSAARVLDDVKGSGAVQRLPPGRRKRPVCVRRQSRRPSKPRGCRIRPRGRPLASRKDHPGPAASRQAATTTTSPATHTAPATDHQVSKVQECCLVSPDMLVSLLGCWEWDLQLLNQSTTR